MTAWEQPLDKVDIRYFRPNHTPGVADMTPRPKSFFNDAPSL